MKNAFEASGSSPTHSESSLQPPPDISIENHGSIFLLRPVTSAGQSWLIENVIGEETQIFGNAVVSEPRFVADIVFGARGEGFGFSSRECRNQELSRGMVASPW